MSVKRKFQNAALRMMEKRWPGVQDVVALLEKIQERISEQYIQGLSELDEKKNLYRQSKRIIQSQSKSTEVEHPPELFKKEDGVWRPTLLTLGLIYKIQKIVDDYWYDEPSIFVSDKEKATNIVELLAKHWWYHMAVVKHVKGDDDEKVKENIAQGLNKPNEDILHVYTTDTKDEELLMKHSPDVVLLVEHEAKELHLVVCGTKMFPMPSMADILMDLYCQNTAWHEGEAHQGMAAAATNILGRLLDTLAASLQQWPAYSLVITGYSLGAGVAELLTIELTKGESAKKLPATTKVQGVAFGAPPVYVHKPRGEVEDFSVPNLISVYNHNDGIGSTTLHTVTKLFLEIKAVERLGLSRRRMAGLLRRKLGHSTLAPGSSVRRYQMDDEEKESTWGDILRALKAVDKSGFEPLHHVAGVTYLMKRHHHQPVAEEHEEFVVRKLEGPQQVAPLSGHFRLRGGMFNDHMPWGYGSLFENCGGNVDGVSFDDLANLYI